ncbi:hypothetical protein LDFHOB_08900 [Candidatus Electronema aureum]
MSSVKKRVTNFASKKLKVKNKILKNESDLLELNVFNLIDNFCCIKKTDPNRLELGLQAYFFYYIIILNSLFTIVRYYYIIVTNSKL